jgi:hypothetical protein
MNNNEGTIPQQIVHLEGIAAPMREDLGGSAATTALYVIFEKLIATCSIGLSPFELSE